MSPKQGLQQLQCLTCLFIFVFGMEKVLNRHPGRRRSLRHRPGRRRRQGAARRRQVQLQAVVRGVVLGPDRKFQLFGDARRVRRLRWVQVLPDVLSEQVCVEGAIRGGVHLCRDKRKDFHIVLNDYRVNHSVRILEQPFVALHWQFSVLPL